MTRKVKTTPEQKKLIRRYLIWCYKTTKEDLDRIDRKFTQLEVDCFMKGELLAALKGHGSEEIQPYQVKVEEFAAYIAEKEKGLSASKYSDESRENLQPDYWYLVKRLEAIKKAIKHFLGTTELKTIADLYEEEMTKRILESREH